VIEKLGTKRAESSYRRGQNLTNLIKWRSSISKRNATWRRLHAYGLATGSASASFGTDSKRLRAATGRANGMGLSLL
jgi:hypothetical protein